jgi:amidase
MKTIPAIEQRSHPKRKCMSEICFMSATDIVSKIRGRELSCQEVMAAHLSQIEQINPEVNAVVTQIPPEQALAEARAADEAIAQGLAVGLLHGLPMAHKDLAPTKEIRITFFIQTYISNGRTIIIK